MEAADPARDIHGFFLLIGATRALLMFSSAQENKVQLLAGLRSRTGVT
jgi:hypothetical protein